MRKHALRCIGRGVEGYVENELDGLTERIIGAAIAVHRHLGPGLLMKDAWLLSWWIEGSLSSVRRNYRSFIEVWRSIAAIELTFWSRGRSSSNSKPSSAFSQFMKHSFNHTCAFLDVPWACSSTSMWMFSLMACDDASTDLQTHTSA